MAPGYPLINSIRMPWRYRRGLYSFHMITHPNSLEMIQERVNNIEGMIARRAQSAAEREKALRELLEEQGEEL